MYSDAFCKVYNEFGWNYFPEAFGQQLLQWIDRNHVPVKTSLDLGCGTGVLCEILAETGIEASGMDFSEGMIRIARERNPHISYDVADMITYRPEKQFDLVTCTGDALNHIIALSDVEKIFRNVYHYLAPGGYFVFDILNESEVSTSEPFDLTFSETVTARFQITRPGETMVNLQLKVYENGELTFEENIRETVHDPDAVCNLLKGCDFSSVQRTDRLLPENKSTTWFVIARK